MNKLKIVKALPYLMLAACICVFIRYLINNNSNRLVEDLKCQIGREIIFPSDLILESLNNNDTINYMDRPYKILIYQDSIGCTGCELRLGNWKMFYNYINETILPSEIAIILLLEINEDDAILLAHQNEWEMPILLDKSGGMNRLYEFSKNTVFKVMLLDQNNKIVIAGNPIESKNMHDLYIKQLLNLKNSK